MQYIPAVILTVITLITVIILFLIYPAWDSKEEDSNGHPNKPRHEKWFYIWLIGLSTLGGFWALFLPLALNQKFDGADADGNQLRLHLLYITGGVLALTTLGETHRKNTLEKHKNDQDHTRQVHAERRSRYITAIEQLSNSDSATTRLGGVYSLVGLVDEWLSDEKTISSIKEHREKAQVIINSLCAYIRSPFPLAERAEQLDKDYAKDLQNDFGGDKRAFAQEKAALKEERQVRQSIIEEICERLRDSGAPGPWSNFDYDFSNTHFFYFADFTRSRFDGPLNFTGATFTQNADFSEAKFTKANFSEAKFTKASFFRAEFIQNVIFSGAEFTRYTDFSEATFQSKPIFTLGNKARFSHKVEPEDYKFEVSHNSPYKIDTEEQKHNGVKFIIPKGTELFDPDEPSE